MNIDQVIHYTQLFYVSELPRPFGRLSHENYIKHWY